MYYYSKTTNGFYNRKIHGNNIPSDAVEITDDVYHLLFVQQSEGKQIVSNDSGHPIAITPQVTPITWEQIKIKRDRLLQQSDWAVLRDSPANNQSEWITYRQALRNIPQNFNNPSDVAWPTKP